MPISVRIPDEDKARQAARMIPPDFPLLAEELSIIIAALPNPYRTSSVAFQAIAHEKPGAAGRQRLVRFEVRETLGIGGPIKHWVLMP